MVVGVPNSDVNRYHHGECEDEKRVYPVVVEKEGKQAECQTGHEQESLHVMGILPAHPGCSWIGGEGDRYRVLNFSHSPALFRFPSRLIHFLV